MIIRGDNPELEYPAAGTTLGSFYIGCREDWYPGGSYYSFKIGYTNRPLSVRLHEYKNYNHIHDLIYYIKSDHMGIVEYIERLVLDECYTQKIERRKDDRDIGDRIIGREWFQTWGGKNEYEQMKNKLIKIADDSLQYINQLSDAERERESRKYIRN